MESADLSQLYERAGLVEFLLEVRRRRRMTVGNRCLAGTAKYHVELIAESHRRLKTVTDNGTISTTLRFVYGTF